METPKVAIGKNLKKLLHEKNLTITEVSRLTGINKSTIHDYLYREGLQSMLVLLKLKQFFGISLDELVIEAKEDINETPRTF